MSISISDLRDCFYSPSTHTIVDLIHPNTGLGAWGRRSLDDVRVEYPDAVVMDVDEASALKEESFRTDPVEITGGQFDEALNVLPPVGWNGQTFRMVERLSGNITGIYAQVGGRYFMFNDSIYLTHEEIMAKVAPMIGGAR